MDANWEMDAKQKDDDDDGLSAKEAADRFRLFGEIAGWDRWENERYNRRRENMTVGVTFAAVVGFAVFCFQFSPMAGIGALLFSGVCYWTGKTVAEATAARWFARMRAREGQQPKPSPSVTPPRQPPPKGESE